MRKQGMALFLFAFHSFASAQTQSPNVVTPETMTGIQPFTTYDGVKENIALANGNLNLNLPLFKLPQRAGRSWTLGINYDSKIWDLFDFAPPGQPASAFWMLDTRLPIIAPYLRLSVPTLQATYNVVAVGQSGTDYCENGWIFTSANGSKHVFTNNEDCQGSYPNGAMNPVHVSESDDGSYIELNTSNLSDIVVYLKDGTQVHFNNYVHFSLYNGVFSKMVDPNGNVITATGTGNNSDGTSAGVYTFTDSVGRVITADLNAHTIGYKDANGTSKNITFANANINTGGPITFTHPLNGECNASSGSQPVGTSDSEWTATIPDGAAGLIYRFHYNAAGELTFLQRCERESHRIGDDWHG
jgi:hypothetical protein